MGKLLRLICMAAILTMFAGCNNGDDPEPQPVQETWLMTYDDYHSMLDINESEKQKYKNLSREVTILRNGDEISIKGIFAEYPDAWVKGRIRNNTVFIGYDQAIGTDGGETVYFNWGYTRHYSEHQYTGNTSGIVEPETIEFGIGDGPALKISDDGNVMTGTTTSNDALIFSFWYDTDNYIGYNKDQTGFPDVDIKVNISFRKISDNKAGSK